MKLKISSLFLWKTQTLAQGSRSAWIRRLPGLGQMELLALMSGVTMTYSGSLQRRLGFGGSVRDLSALLCA